MEEIVFVKQTTDKWETTIKCDKSVKRIEVVFKENSHLKSPKSLA